MLDAKLSTPGSFENSPFFVVVRVTVAPTVFTGGRHAAGRHCICELSAATMSYDVSR